MRTRVLAWAACSAFVSCLTAPAAAEERAFAALDSLSSVSPPAPRGALTLRQAQQLAAEHAPDVRGAAWEATAAAARLEDAGRLANPTLVAEAENLGVLNGVLEEYTLGAEQTFELGGKRTARRELASANAALSASRLSASRWRASANAAERFFDAWAMQERLLRLRRAERLAAEQVRAAEERFRAGAGPEVEGLRAQVQLAERRAERMRLDVESEGAKRRLAATWGAPEASFDSLAFDAAGAPPGSGASVAAHPEISAANLELQVAEAQLREARAARSVDVSVYAGARYFAEPDAVGAVAGVSLPLPIWNRFRGTAAAAEGERGAAQARLKTATLRAGTGLRDAESRYHAASTLHATLVEDALPKAERVLQGLLSGYRAGRFRYLEVLEAQRSLLDIELAAVEAAAEAGRARSEIDLLTVGAAPEGER